MSEQNKERLLELLADQALFSLTEEEQVELRKLEDLYPEVKDDFSLELTASAISLINIQTDEPMPAALRSKILADADEYFAKEAAPHNVLDFQSKRREIIQPVAESAPRSSVGLRSTGSSPWQWLGWVAAAAACIALIANLWYTRVQNTPATEPVIAQQREQLIKETPDIIKVDWSKAAPTQEANVSGDIVWSNSKQKGFMRLSGFPKNDPNKETYQLWIIDANQDDKTPIDGGVFNVNEAGEVIIPINAKLQVGKPQMFAVTAEKPGGVVVSKREKLLAIAKVAV